MTPLLTIQNLTFQYKNGEKQLFNELSIEVKEGECVVIKGNNGSGKSTLLDLIFNNSTSRKYPNNGKIMYDRFEVNSSVAFVFQKPENQLLTFKVKEELVTKLSFSGVSRQERKEIAKRVIDSYSMTHLQDKDPHHLSAGEQQKLVVLATTIKEEKIILLDEPLTFLDQSNLSTFRQHLNELFKAGYTLIISTHENYFDNMATQTLVLGDTTARFDEILRDFTNQVTEKSIVISGEIGFDKPIQKIEFKLNKTGVYAILGNNGSGKTCLLLTMAGIQPSISGDLKIQGKLGILPRNPNYVFSKPTVEEELGNIPIPPQFQVNLKSSPFQLSVGEQKYLAIYILLKKYDICLIDEPFQSLDNNFENHILDLIETVKEDKLIIFSSNRSLDLMSFQLGEDQIIELED